MARFSGLKDPLRPDDDDSCWDFVDQVIMFVQSLVTVFGCVATFVAWACQFDLAETHTWSSRSREGTERGAGRRLGHRGTCFRVFRVLPFS